MYEHEPRLRAGSATVDITPDQPVLMGGYGGRAGKSTGVHDPLFATALVVEDGVTTIGIASLDVLNVSHELTHRVRVTLSSRGLEFDSLIVAATHTHAGPYIPARTLDVSPPLRPEEDVSEVVDEVESGLVRAFERAADRLESATVRVGHATESNVQENRRAAGGVGGNVRVPHGPVDPDVTTIVIETAAGTETVLYNFACHPVCATPAETELSADWPAYARRRIEAERDGATVLFLNGAAGDINPVDPPETEYDAYEAMDYVGSRVGDAVLRAIADAGSTGGRTYEQTHVRCREVDVTLPVKRTPPVDRIEKRMRELDAQLDRLKANGDDVGRKRVYWDQRYAEELLAIAEWDVDSLPNTLPLVEIGDLAVLGMPGEIHARHGLDFRAHSNASSLVLAGYANGYVGYVPTLSDLENGGYEVRTAKIAPEAITEFRHASLELVGGSNRY